MGTNWKTIKNLNCFTESFQARVNNLKKTGGKKIELSLTMTTGRLTDGTTSPLLQRANERTALYQFVVCSSSRQREREWEELLVYIVSTSQEEQGKQNKTKANRTIRETRLQKK
jgi:hypothetical protein